MSSVVHRPGSLLADLSGQSQLQDIRWEVSQSNLNLIATKAELEKHGVRIDQGLRDVSERLEGIDQTLVQGVITLHTDLLAVEGSVRDLSAAFEFGIAQLEAGIGDVRASLEDLVRLAKSPEQTWAYEQYDLARDAYRRGLFPEALEHVNRAINGYQGRTGHRLEHRFHRLLGMIYRTKAPTPPDMRDLPKSKQAYLDAARYAGKDHAEDAAWALYAAARLSFDARDISEAEGLFRQALTFVDFKEGRYWLAKVLMHQDEVEAGLLELKKAIEGDRRYSVKCFEAEEIEFLKHQGKMRSAIDGWRITLKEECQRSFDQCMAAVARCREVSEQTNAVVATFVSKSSGMATLNISTLGPSIFVGLLTDLGSAAQALNYQTYFGASEAMEGMKNFRNRIGQAIDDLLNRMEGPTCKELRDAVHLAHVVEPEHASDSDIDNWAVGSGFILGGVSSVATFLSSCPRHGALDPRTPGLQGHWNALWDFVGQLVAAIAGGLILGGVLGIIVYSVVKALAHSSTRRTLTKWEFENHKRKTAVEQFSMEADARIRELAGELRDLGRTLAKPVAG